MLDLLLLPDQSHPLSMRVSRTENLLVSDSELFKGIWELFDTGKVPVLYYPLLSPLCTFLALFEKSNLPSLKIQNDTIWPLGMQIKAPLQNMLAAQHKMSLNSKLMFPCLLISTLGHCSGDMGEVEHPHSR